MTLALLWVALPFDLGAGDGRQAGPGTPGHLVSQVDLQSRLAAAALQRDRDIGALDKGALRSLRDGELHDLARRAEALQTDPASAEPVGQALLTVFLVALLIIFIVGIRLILGGGV